MRLRIINNETGEQSVFESDGCDVLIESHPDCDIVLPGAKVSGQYARLIRLPIIFTSNLKPETTA